MSKYDNYFEHSDPIKEMQLFWSRAVRFRDCSQIEVCPSLMEPKYPSIEDQENYRILDSDDQEYLANKVSQYIQKWWLPCGWLSVTKLDGEICYYQAIYLPSNNQD